MNKKTRIPRQNRSVQTRDKIIIAALELFSEKGFHSTNSKEITARAGVSIGIRTKKNFSLNHLNILILSLKMDLATMLMMSSMHRELLMHGKN
jgi:DNA-binding transcriptional regulator YbjK